MIFLNNIHRVQNQGLKEVKKLECRLSVKLGEAKKQNDSFPDSFNMESDRDKRWMGPKRQPPPG